MSFISLQLVLNGALSIFYYRDAHVSALNVRNAHPLHPLPTLQLFIILSVQGFSLQVHFFPHLSLFCLHSQLKMFVFLGFFCTFFFCTNDTGTIVQTKVGLVMSGPSRRSVTEDYRRGLFSISLYLTMM